MGLAPATKFKPHNHKMAVSRVYMCAPGIIPPDAPRIERGDTAVGVVTAEGPVRKLPLTLNRACFLKGDQCAATRVDLIGEPQARWQRRRQSANGCWGRTILQKRPRFWYQSAPLC